jgi:aminopeptidase N
VYINNYYRTLVFTDHIALPSKGGAMENWGLITYGESVICIDPETSAAAGKFGTASVIAHELAHQVNELLH